MHQGVLVPPTSLSGRPRARARLAALALIATLALAVVKPWDAIPAAGPAAASASNLGADDVGVAVTSPPRATPRPPAWPVQSAPGPDAADPLTIQDAAELVALRGGAWGVGAGGSGPRLVRDEVWADWLAVTSRSIPAPSTPSAEPSPEDTCAGLPTLVDRPSILAVTSPVGATPPAWHVAAWWSGGGVVTPIMASVQVLALPSTAGADVLQRLDHAVWPGGRYDFQLTAGRTSVALAMCLETAL